MVISNIVSDQIHILHSGTGSSLDQVIQAPDLIHKEQEEKNTTTTTTTTGEDEGA